MYSLLEFDYSRLSYFHLSIYLVISCWIVLLTLPYFNSRLDIFHSSLEFFFFSWSLIIPGYPIFIYLFI